MCGETAAREQGLVFAQVPDLHLAPGLGEQQLVERARVVDRLVVDERDHVSALQSHALGRRAGRHGAHHHQVALAADDAEDLRRSIVVIGAEDEALRIAGAPERRDVEVLIQRALARRREQDIGGAVVLGGPARVGRRELRLQRARELRVADQLVALGVERVHLGLEVLGDARLDGARLDRLRFAVPQGAHILGPVVGGGASLEEKRCGQSRGEERKKNDRTHDKPPWFPRADSMIREDRGVKARAYFILDGRRTLRPATMNSPRPRWCRVRGRFTDGSIQALTTRRMKKLYFSASRASTTLHSRLA